MQQVAPDSQLTLLRGTLLQLALRALLTAFIVVTLLLEPPVRDRWICVAVLMVYVVVIGCWSVWVRTPARAALPARTAVTLLVSAADVLVVSALSVLSGVTSPQEWTSDVVRMGFFLIPLIAAAQLDPVISAAVAVPTVSAFLATCWITRSANEEPWASILLSCAVLAGLAGGSVALSFIQRSVVDTVVELARQRNQLLEELLGLESASAKRFRNVCTTAPCSTSWSRDKIWKRSGRVRRLPRTGWNRRSSNARGCCAMWSANFTRTC